MFFGGGSGGGPGRQATNKSKPMVHKLGVTLEELYNGKLRKLAANRDLKCDDCDGKGDSSDGGANSHCKQWSRQGRDC